MNNKDMQQVRDTLASSWQFKPTAQVDEYQQGIAVREALALLDAALARDEKPVGIYQGEDYKHGGNRIGLLGKDIPIGSPLYLHPPETSRDAEKPVDTALLEKSLRTAFNMGQTYWSQADSESYSQNKKSFETADRFKQFLVDTVAAMKEVKS